MKRKKFVLIFTFLLISINVFSQENLKRQVAYVELVGSGVFGSVNYDFRFKPGNDGLGMRTGLGYVPDVLVIPIGLNGLVGKNRIAFEYGAGVSASVFFKSKSGNQTFSSGINNLGFIGFAKAGIRVTPKNNGLFFNINWNPMINTDEIRWIWFGIGIGYSWKK